MKAFRAMTKAQWLSFWREKHNVFWVILFPLMFLLIFGTLMRDTDAPRANLGIIGDVPLMEALPKAADSSFEDLFAAKEYKGDDARQKALEEVRNGGLDAAVEMNGSALLLHYTQTDQVQAARVQSIFQSFVQSANTQVTGVTGPYALEVKRVEDASLKPIQFFTPGILGWAIAMGATFGAAMPLVEWRNTQLLRRLRLTPARSDVIIWSRALVSITVAFIQLAIFIVVAKALFGLQLNGSWWVAIPIVTFATVAFMAVGLLAGAVSKTTEGASGLANLIILPMAFLSGSFFQLDAAPSWLVAVARVLPLYHVNSALSDVLVRGMGPASAVVPILILIAFAVVFALLAARLFRWEN